MIVGFVVGILVMALGLISESERLLAVFMIAGSVIFFAALIQACIFYRCPHCNHSLMHVRGGIPDYCPNCGKELTE